MYSMCRSAILYILYVSVCVSTQACLLEDVLICQRGRQSVLWPTGLNPFVRGCVSVSETLSVCVEHMLENRLTCAVCLGLHLDSTYVFMYLY